MRTRLLFAVAIVSYALPAAAQGNRRGDTGRTTRPDNAGRSSDERFTPALRAGQRLSVSNIDGNVTVTQGRGDRAEIVAHKIVRKGNGDLVKAVLEQTSGGYRICTVYLDDARDERGCSDGNHGGNHGWREPLDVDMQFDIRLPAGVLLTVNSVDGNIEATGIDTPATLRSVDGDIMYEGVAPEALNSVDGTITARITDGDWKHSVSMRTVDGDIEVTLPASSNARINGHTIDGKIDSDFPVTITGKWGPQSFHGDIGNGRGEALQLSSVDGSIRLHSSDGPRRAGRNDRSRP